MRIRQGHLAVDVNELREITTQMLQGYQYTLLDLRNAETLFVSHTFNNPHVCYNEAEEHLRIRTQAFVKAA
jgi:hypothetical protein